MGRTQVSKQELIEHVTRREWWSGHLPRVLLAHPDPDREMLSMLRRACALTVVKTPRGMQRAVAKNFDAAPHAQFGLIIAAAELVTTDGFALDRVGPLPERTSLVVLNPHNLPLRTAIRRRDNAHMLGGDVPAPSMAKVVRLLAA